MDNFIVKHWVNSHLNLAKQLRMCFKVRKSFTDPLSRLVTEAVLIEREGKLNSKSEWGHNKLERLAVERPEWMLKKEFVLDASANKEIEAKVAKLRENVDRNLSKANSTPSNADFSKCSISSRGRKIDSAIRQDPQRETLLLLEKYRKKNKRRRG